MFKSILRPVRVSRFSKTVRLPQNNSSPTPSSRHGFNFDTPPGSRCLAQPPAWIRRNTTPVVTNNTEQTQRSLRTLLANSRSSRFSLRLCLVFFPHARPLLSDASFAPSRCGFLFLRRGRLPLPRCFAFLTQLLLVQIRS